jgi:ABC-2 type transport system permease protein
MNTQKIITQFKREYWENKIGFVYIPLIITALFMLAFVCTVSYGVSEVGVAPMTKVDNRCFGAACEANLEKFKDYVVNTPEGFDNIVLGIMYTNCILVSAALALVLISFLHRCLFDDRKERDILFWRSMPVSETMNVLCKLGVVIFGAPMVVLLTNIIVGVFLVLLAALVSVVQGIDLSYLASSLWNAGHLDVPFIVFYENIYWMLLLLPIVGFFLAASAFAKKSPFMASTLVPMLLVLADYLLNKYVGFSLGISHLVGAYAEILLAAKNAIAVGQLLQVTAAMLQDLLKIILIGSGLVAVAIWLRNNRYEI